MHWWRWRHWTVSLWFLLGSNWRVWILCACVSMWLPDTGGPLGRHPTDAVYRVRHQWPRVVQLCCSLSFGYRTFCFPLYQPGNLLSSVLFISFYLTPTSLWGKKFPHVPHWQAVTARWNVHLKDDMFSDPHWGVWGAIVGVEDQAGRSIHKLWKSSGQTENKSLVLMCANECIWLALNFLLPTLERCEATMDTFSQSIM